MLSPKRLQIRFSIPMRGNEGRGLVLDGEWIAQVFDPHEG